MRKTRTQILYVNRGNSTKIYQIRCLFLKIDNELVDNENKHRKLWKVSSNKSSLVGPIVLCEKWALLQILLADYLFHKRLFFLYSLFDLVLTNIFISSFFNALKFWCVNFDRNWNHYICAGVSRYIEWGLVRMRQSMMPITMT